MDKIEITKKVVGITVQYGCGIIVGGIIKNNVVTTNTMQKIGVVAAGFALGGTVGNKAADYTDAFIDGIVVEYRKLREETKK